MGAEPWVGALCVELSSETDGFELTGFTRGRREQRMVRVATKQEGTDGQWV